MSTCPIPFNQLYVHSSGEVYPCSFLQNNTDFILGHIQKNSLADIWKSEKLASFRHKHLTDLPLSCSKYQTNYSCHKIGQRRDFDFTSNTIKRLDLMLDSACNLTCQMCTNIYDKSGGFKDDYFWKNNEDTLSTISELEVVGGEPLISPHYYRLVSLVSSINPKVEWRITTNANYPITTELAISFNTIKLQTISVSLDSLKPEIFESIRARSNFKLVYENIEKINRIVPSIQINMVVQQSNCDEVISLFEWTREMKYRFYPILLVHPRSGSILERPIDMNKKYLIELMRKNEILKSTELFFLIKKIIDNLSLKKDAEISRLYVSQLCILGAGDGT